MCVCVCACVCVCDSRAALHEGETNRDYVKRSLFFFFLIEFAFTPSEMLLRVVYTRLSSTLAALCSLRRSLDKIIDFVTTPMPLNLPFVT